MQIKLYLVIWIHFCTGYVLQLLANCNYHNELRIIGVTILGVRIIALLILKKLLKPFGITKSYTDRLKTYERHLPLEKRQISKLKMQTIERKHLTLRTRIKRLARKSICFSKSVQMHDLEGQTHLVNKNAIFSKKISFFALKPIN